MTLSPEELHQQKLNQWRPHVETWQKSSLSKSEYCKAHQLNVGQFYYWFNIMSPPLKKKEPKISTLNLAEVKVTPSPVLFSAAEMIEIHTPNHYQVKISSPVNTTVLTQVLTCLRRVL